ncbi:SCAN domain-containing protein 3-like [Neoarius graeffei]|uniref:SCAN domain-containing protein 3-like n=1 Tax=Neoarius graeffei TaxID=443677 RepID=UPI00298C2801|nr:SCAN domain-containing protein 3-like [Neoarius graeffei]
MYADLQRAVLQHVSHSPEQQRQRFRSLCLEEVGRPFAFRQQLRDTCWQWLRGDDRDTEGIIDLVILEQFIMRLPEGTAEWVQCHRPASLDQAIELAEDHMAAVPTAGRCASLSSLFPSPSASRLCLIPPPWRQRLAPPPQPAQRTHGVLPFSPSLSVSPPPPPPPQVSDVSDARNTGAEGEPGRWRCGELGHLQNQCSVMEVGAVVQVPDTPETTLDRAGAYRIPVNVQGDTYQALVNSGCNHTSIHQCKVSAPL